MQVFRIGPEGIKVMKMRLLVRILPLLIIGVSVGFFLGTFNSKGKGNSTDVLPFIIPFYLIIIVFSVVRTISKQKKSIESYTLTFSANQISRIQLNTPQVSIDYNEIKEIGTLKDGSLMIKGPNSTDLICIPSYIENYAEIHQRLDQIRPISQNSNLPFWLKYRIVMSLLNMGLLVAVILVTNKWVVAICGSIFIALTTWSLLKIYESKSIDNKTKRGALWSLVVILAVLILMIDKLNAS